MTSGGAHHCARTHAGQIDCWGSNRYGQLGSGGVFDMRLVPTLVSPLTANFTEPGLNGIRDASAGGSFTCATDTDHKVWCWGQNWDAQLGFNPTWEPHVEMHYRPVLVEGVTAR